MAIRGRPKAAVAHVTMAWIRMSSCMSTKLFSRPSIVAWCHSMTVPQGGKEKRTTWLGLDIVLQAGDEASFPLGQSSKTLAQKNKGPQRWDHWGS